VAQAHVRARARGLARRQAASSRSSPRRSRCSRSRAIRDISHLFRPGHLQQLRAILDDPEASANDRFVALQLLKNADVSAGMVLPSCQDTGTAIVIGKKGQHVWTDGDDEAALSEGVYRTFTETNLRYSQMRRSTCTRRRTPIQPAGADRPLRRPKATSTSSCS
jgi:tartrate dehydratase alpha subunit/fumarate hydratase class I-like protein